MRNAKLGGRAELWSVLGAHMAREPRLQALAGGSAGQRPLVVAVPAHRGGGRHAEALARALGRAWQLEFLTRGLRRRRSSHASQTGVSAQARRRRLGASFAARPGLVSDRDLVLVDDVLTTGGTADAATRALLVSGARSVRVATLTS